MKSRLIALNKYNVVLASAYKGHSLDLLQAAGIISKDKTLSDDYRLMELKINDLDYSFNHFDHSCQHQWLGHGVYFNAQKDGCVYIGNSICEDASEGKARYSIDGNCLDLNSLASLSLVEVGDRILRTALIQIELRSIFDGDGKEMFLARANCAAIQMLHHVLVACGFNPFDYTAGQVGADGQNQLCVRAPQCINLL